MIDPTEHDPAAFAAELGQKLASRARRVAFLFGAGISTACGLPDVSGLEKEIAGKLDAEERDHFERLVANGSNLEKALSRLRRIAALVGDGETVDGLTATAARNLDARVCAEIVEALRLERADLSAMRDFARWIVRSDYAAPLEIFTVNYDLLLEAALEHERALYFDGFVGVHQARFQVELVDDWRGAERATLPASFARLWKLHGSLNWIWSGSRPSEVLRLGHAAPDGDVAAIYPADTKYEESRRLPFVVLQDHFRRVLQRPESLVLIAGYSFSDDDLNELIFDAASRHPRSEFLAFSFSALPATAVAAALLTPNLTLVGESEAVRGGERADWSAPQDDVPDVWESGKFVLGNFAKLARHLSRDAHKHEPVISVGA